METIPELEEEEVYGGAADNLDKSNLKRYMSKTKAYGFDETVKFVDRNKNETYKTFLNTIIPKTRVLFELIKKYIKNGTSYNKIIEYLEPQFYFDPGFPGSELQTLRG